MSILATIWFIVKILLLTLAATATLTLLIALFHPLKFNLKLRATIKGQRAELWFVYLFKILQIGIIATPHTQDVVIKLFFWQRLLERQQRPKRPAPAKVDKTAAAPPVENEEKTKDSVKVEPIENTVTTKPVANTEPIKNDPPQPTESSQKAPDPAPTTVTPEQDAAAQTPPEKSIAADENATIVTEAVVISESPPLVPPEKVSPTPISTAPIKPLAQVAEDLHKQQKPQPTPDKETSAAAPKSEWRQKMRKFKHDLSNRYRQLQKYLRLTRQKWRILAPALKKFWQRGKKGFGLDNPSLLLRYALHEPYLTGMLQGSMAVVSGIVDRLGINFVPVPTFSEPGVYAKGCATAIIRPWRLVVATIGLLCERKLWHELWLAFKWYRTSKARAI